MKRKLSYAIIVITIPTLCVYLGYEAIRINRLSNFGAKMSLSTKKFEHKIEGKNDILILGDSLAFGVGASNPEVSFAGKIAKEYKEQSITNNAVIGETVVSLKNTIDNKVTSRYKKIFIIVGGNDIMRIHFNIYNSANSLEYVIKKASQNADKVVLISTGKFDNVSLSPKIMKSIFNYRANVIRQSALKLEKTYDKFDYIDFYSVPINESEYKRLEAGDGYHLNDYGVNKLVSTVLQSN